MYEDKIWKIVERVEQLSDRVEDINDYLDKVHETHLAYNTWIQQATENMLDLSKEVKYLKHKRTCV